MFLFKPVLLYVEIPLRWDFSFKVANGSPLFDTIVDSLDIITIVVPPALPAALSVGKYYAQQRLLEQNISCMNASVINVSGSINCVCFDKVRHALSSVARYPSYDTFQILNGFSL